MLPIFENFPPLENSYSVILRRTPMNSLHEDNENSEIGRKNLLKVYCDWPPSRKSPSQGILDRQSVCLQTLPRYAITCIHECSVFRSNSVLYRDGAAYHSLGFEDENLGSSPGRWAASVATYCPSRPGELPKFLSSKLCE